MSIETHKNTMQLNEKQQLLIWIWSIWIPYGMWCAYQNKTNLHCHYRTKLIWDDQI